jgi:DHA1 family multidrug resistance protein-like MFS transporter
MIGGILSKVSHAFPFYFAGGMALLNGISAYFFLDESNHHRNPAPIIYNPLRPILRAMQSPVLRPLYMNWFFYSLSFVVVQTTFALFAQHAFRYDSFQTGMLFTFIGVVIALNQTLLLNRFWIQRFSNHQLELMMLVMALIGLGLAATQNLYLFFAGIPFIGTSQAVYRVVIANDAIQRTDPVSKGEIMGTIASVMTLAMVISPIAGGYLFERNISYPFLAGMFFILVAIFNSTRR